MPASKHIKTAKDTQSYIYHLVYKHGPLARPEIARRLGVSLPTVMQGVKELVDRGLLLEGQPLESTGGRKAVGITCASNARCALGIDITQNHISAVVVNLTSEILAHKRITLPFAASADYWQIAASLSKETLQQSGMPKEAALGVGISLPGIVDKEGSALLYSHVLKQSGLQTATLKAHFGRQILLCNDANAAGIAEMWGEHPTQSALYLSLSNSVGGAIIMQNMPLWGEHGRCGEFGHATLVPEGAACYCGRKGCMDVYCNVGVLSRHTDGNLQTFFARLASGDTTLAPVWQEYLHWLSTALNNLLVSFDSPVILGGYMGEHLEPYLPQIRNLVAARSTFPGSENNIRPCRYQKEAAAVGAALLWVAPFLEAL